jgi:hypothetical protein
MEKIYAMNNKAQESNPVEVEDTEQVNFKDADGVDRSYTLPEYKGITLCFNLQKSLQ